MMPYISICIPSYKRIDFLKRLLDSIAIQNFRDFEVIVTDDSPSEEVKFFCELYNSEFVLYYYKNEVALGTPENWNEAIRRANGEWIKLMHDDDWFSGPESLNIFAEAARKKNNAFIFSGYTNVYFPDEKMEEIRPSSYRMKQLKNDPVSLLSKNIIGPPSVTMYKNFSDTYYDKNIKWLVDIDFYVQKLSNDKFYYINSLLVNVGLGDEQVTAMCHTNPEVEIPENFYFLNKFGVRHLKNIMVYDAWWRLLRNLNIVNETHLQQYVSDKSPDIIFIILKDVRRFSNRILRIGVVSKLIMALSYLKNKGKIK